MSDSDTTAIFSLDAVLAKTPAAFQPLVAKYGPIFVQWSAQQFWDWINLLVAGKNKEAWANLDASMSNQQLAQEFINIGDDIFDATNANAASMQWQRDLAMGTMKVLAGVLLAAIGFPI